MLQFFFLNLKMKKNILFTAVLLCFLYACKKTDVHQNEKKTVVQNSNIFSVDSVAVNDSMKINDKLTVGFGSKVLVFPTIKNKSLLDSIYTMENIYLDDYSSDQLLAALKKKQKDYYFHENKENTEDFPWNFEQTWYQNSDMDVFSIKNDFMTLKYSGDGFSGGAHGYYYEYYRVFDLKNNKTLQLSDVLINPESAVWKRALMDHFLKNDLDQGQSEMLLVKEISPNRNFYFDKNFVYFLYNQYEIAAYAAGPVLIKLPVSDIKMILNPELKTRLGIQ
jgi:hypothetical protein